MIYITNGAPSAGKDTFCQKVIDITTPEFGIILSTVDLVKEIARDLGWDGEKTPKARKFLSDLKDILTEWDDIPARDVEGEIDKFLEYTRKLGADDEEVAIFVMCREPNEIKKMCDRLNAKSLLVRRDAVEGNEQSNHADAEVFNYDYDIEIDNNGTLEDLAYAAIEFAANEGLYTKHWETLKVDSSGKICYTINRKREKRNL